MFYNMNDLNLGEVDEEKTRKKIPLNDIIMPPWSNNNAYTFIKYHREMLESIEISEKIHDWFNIIFGIKQKGNLAKNIHNLFFAQTYDDFDDPNRIFNSMDVSFENAISQKSDLRELIPEF